GPAINARVEQLFERGIDPDSAESAVARSGAHTEWPSRAEVLDFADRADAAIVSALEEAEFRDDRPAMHRAQALYTALEHEAMHQETLLYMWHRLPYGQKTKPGSVVRDPGSGIGDGGSGRRDAGSDMRHLWLSPSDGRTRDAARAGERVRIPAGAATLGADPDRITFGWDNEFDEHRVD